MCYHKGVLNLQAQFGAQSTEDKWLLLNEQSQGRGRWLLLGTKRTSRDPMLWKFHPEQDYQELAAIPNYLEVVGVVHRRGLSCWKENCMIIPSCPKLIIGIVITELAPVFSCFRSIWDWLPVKPIYSSLLLTASAWLTFTRGWASLTVSTLAASDLTFCFSQHVWVSGLLGMELRTLCCREFLSAEIFNYDCKYYAFLS